MLSLSLAETESGVKYYFKNSIKRDKETILYCALRVADIIDDDEMWKEIYKYGLSQKIKPRDELTKEYQEKIGSLFTQISIELKSISRSS